MFARAIAREVPNTISAGITTADLGQPATEKAREQHRSYRAALEDCGVEVIMLAPDDRYPDSVFVEDTAVVTDRCVIIMNLELPRGGGRSARYCETSTGTSNGSWPPVPWTAVMFSRSGITSTSVYRRGRTGRAQSS